MKGKQVREINRAINGFPYSGMLGTRLRYPSEDGKPADNAKRIVAILDYLAGRVREGVAEADAVREERDKLLAQRRAVRAFFNTEED